MKIAELVRRGGFFGSSPSARRGAASAAAVLVVVALLVWWWWPESTKPVVLHAATPDRSATVTVGNPRLGSSDIDIALADGDGKAVAGATIRVAAVEESSGAAGPPVTATATDSGRYRAADVPFTATGQWELRVLVENTVPLILPLWIGD
ncbi:hypothetical protein NRB56_13880 [Nocardia sp. RB56]|uniref:YtkA-like domain-containing protein n=2 Tax=Nocardia aurantia TaxID=2585199 RepID=A0A7K0DJE5_9NOCA|nr:hypothetical protein [Nocardia aurantia]